ncbi:hypothetical protein B0J14DRAFT_643613 [Halenospora varia]|nr:hypothetical protein B0J14DRAFT_643613 [Halenospora varia]
MVASLITFVSLLACCSAAAIPAEQAADTSDNIHTSQILGYNVPVVDGAQDTAIFDVWQDINYSGRHEGLVNTIGYCYTLKNGWANSISSARAGSSGYRCTLFAQDGCKGGFYIDIFSSGSSSVGDMNDLGKSYYCHY